MKTKQLEHGTAFSESFSVILRGEVADEPLGWGGKRVEKVWLERELKRAVTEAISAFYQCELIGTSLEVHL